MHIEIPDEETEARDQREFDEAVNRTGKVVLEWLAGLGVLAAVLMSMVALVQSGQKVEVAAPPPAALQQTSAVASLS